MANITESGSTVVAGEITQIDFDEQQRIKVIRVLQPDGLQYEIQLSYPAVLPEMRPDQNPYVILRPQSRPEVSVVRLVTR